MNAVRTTNLALLALALAGCGDDTSPGGEGGEAPSSSTTTTTTSTASGEAGGGQGGDGTGGDGTGGTGGDGGAGGATTAPGVAELAFRNQSHGESWSLVAVDLDDDGSDEVVLGSRGVAAFSTSGFATNQPRWIHDFAGADGTPTRGDNEWAYAMATLNVDGDGVPDLVVTTSFLELIALSGADGSAIWSTAIEGSFPTGVVTFDAGDDDVLDVFVVGDRRAFSGSTGAELWSADLPDIMIQAHAAELDGDAGGEIVVGIEEDGIVGPAGGSGGGTAPVTLHAVDGDGTTLFAYQAGESVTDVHVVDLDGDGVAEIVAAAGDAIHVVDAAGSPLAVLDVPVDAYARQVVGVPVGDEVQIVVALEDWLNGHRVEAYDLEGTLLWAQPFSKDGPVLLLDVLAVGDRPLVLLGTGESSPPTGALFALDPGATDEARIAWRVASGLPVTTWTRAIIDGEDTVLLGGWSTIVDGVDPATGASRLAYTSGSFVAATAAGDLDGDGVDEVVTVDDHANVRCVGADGVERWTGRLTVGSAGAASAVVLADLEGDGAVEVVVGGSTFESTDDHGIIDVFSAGGEHLRAIHTEGWIDDVDVADLGGDGQLAIVAGESAIPCRASAFDAAGERLFGAEVAPCFFAMIATGDLDGEPGDEIGYADVKLTGSSNVALVRGDGDVAWNLTPEELETWIDVHDGQLVFGGAAPGFTGHVTSRAAADGSILWQTSFEGVPDPGLEGETIAGSVRSAAWLDDGSLVVGLRTGELAFVDAEGAVVHQTSLVDEALAGAARPFPGAIVLAPAHDGIDATLVVGMGADGRQQTAIHSVTLDGAITGTIPTLGEAHAAALGATAGGAPIAYVGAGLDLWAVTLSP